MNGPQLRDRVTFTDEAGAEHTAIVTHVHSPDLIDLTVEHGEGNYTSYGSVARAGSGVAGTWRPRVDER